MKLKNFLVGILPVIFCTNLFAQNSLFDNDSLRYKIGQMMVYGFLGGTLPDHIKNDIINYNIGGFILRSFMNLDYGHDEARKLIRDLQTNAYIPLLIAIDQEPGIYGHLTTYNGFEDTPSAYELGLLSDEQTTRAIAEKFAGWFQDLGLNTNLAPVVDLRFVPDNVIGDRSFGVNPDTVIQNATWFIDEFRKKGLLTTIKHFPGHGSATEDSHVGFTDVSETWQDIELQPFKSLIDSDLVDIVMTAHIYNTKFDTIHPATLSYNTITTLLRDSLHYDGVVMSDEMFMSAIYQNYPKKEAITLAINAGVDILLYNREIDYLSSQKRMAPFFVDYVETQVLEGAIPRERIEESYRRIMKLKQNLNPFTNIENQFDDVPKNFVLTNYPNPFNSATIIQYALPEESTVCIAVHDLLGRKIVEIDTGRQRAGTYFVQFDASNLTSGIYIYQLSANNFVSSQKMLLVK